MPDQPSSHFGSVQAGIYDLAAWKIDSPIEDALALILLIALGAGLVWLADRLIKAQYRD